MKTAPVEITCKMGLQKDNFLAYKLSGCFSTAIFLDMDISGHSLLVKQIVVPWKFQENGFRVVGHNRIFFLKFRIFVTILVKKYDLYGNPESSRENNSRTWI